MWSRVLRVQARDGLGWVATKTLDDMCADAWRWQSKNPYGMVPPAASRGSTPSPTVTAHAPQQVRARSRQRPRYTDRAMRLCCCFTAAAAPVVGLCFLLPLPLISASPLLLCYSPFRHPVDVY